MQSDDLAVRAAAAERWDNLTKPPGSLGRLEELVIEYAAMRGETMPGIERRSIYVFCGDHGVTAHMVRSFLAAGVAVEGFEQSYLEVKSYAIR